MSTFETRPEKRIARKHAVVEPRYVGTDERGAVHYWDHYARKMIVVGGDEAAVADHVTVDGSDEPLAELDRPLKHWSDYTAEARGWTDCRISADPSLVGGI